MAVITNKAGQTGFNSSQEEEENEGESDDDPSLGNLEGVALVSLATGIIVRLNPDKIYLDSCASHIQVYLTRYMRETFETQIGLHTIRNESQNTASEIGLLINGGHQGLVGALWGC